MTWRPALRSSVSPIAQNCTHSWYGEWGRRWSLNSSWRHYVLCDEHHSLLCHCELVSFLKDHWKYTIYRTHQNLYNNGHYDYVFKCKRTFYQNLGGLYRDVDCFWESYTSESEPGALSASHAPLPASLKSAWMLCNLANRIDPGRGVLRAKMD